MSSQLEDAFNEAVERRVAEIRAQDAAPFFTEQQESDTWIEGGSYEPGRVVRATVSIRVRRKWWEWLLRRPVQYRQEQRYYRATGQTTTAREPTWPTR